MLIGMPILLAMFFAMLNVRADVGGLPIQDRHRRQPGGGSWAPGPGQIGPGGPITTPPGTSTPTNSGPKGPGGGPGPIGIDTSGDPSGLKGEAPTGATPQYDYYRRWRLETEIANKLYEGKR